MIISKQDKEYLRKVNYIFDVMVFKKHFFLNSFYSKFDDLFLSNEDMFDLQLNETLFKNFLYNCQKDLIKSLCKKKDIIRHIFYFNYDKFLNENNINVIMINKKVFEGEKDIFIEKFYFSTFFFKIKNKKFWKNYGVNGLIFLQIREELESAVDKIYEKLIVLEKEVKKIIKEINKIQKRISIMKKI